MNFLKYAGLLLILYSCTWETADKVSPDCSNVSDTISFKKDIQPIFNTYCSLSGCHSGASPTGSLNLEPAFAYAQLSKKGTGYIDTINPRYSVLYSSMTSLNDPMPPTGRLDACKLKLIENWMLQKAKNN